MSQNTSYPSPNSAQAGQGPFYASQHQLPVAEDVQTSAPQPHRAPPTSGERDGERDAETDERPQAVRNTQELRHLQIASPIQLAQGGLESAQHYDPSGDPSSRKRTKVSRACDECRRKKIRCDATSEASGAQCSSCKRAEIFCMFSRTPQKRGPSKGYIKELAERVGALEGRRPMPPMASYPYGVPYGDQSPQPEELGLGSTRKRTHSMSEYTQDHALGRESLGRYPPTTTNEWSGRDTARQMGQASPNFALTANSDQASSVKDPEAPNAFPRRGNNHQNDQSDGTFEWDEYAVEEYYRLIHATHPLLPDSKAELHLHLVKTSGPVREAFLAAFQTLVKPVASTSGSDLQNVQVSSKAVRLLSALQFEDATSRSFSDNLVFVQAILLMVLTTDMDVIASSQPPIWYNMANCMSSFLALSARQPYKNNTDPEIAELEKLARRAWLLLITLDRWHAASTSYSLVTPPEDAILLRQDNALLGDVGFHFARLSLTLGHITIGLRYHSEHPFVDARSGEILFQALGGELERVRESVEPLFASVPFLHLSYLHVKLILNRHALAHHVKFDGVEGVALQIVAILCTDQCLVTPLTHHFASLSAATLVEIEPAAKTGETVRGLQDLRYWLEKGAAASAPESGRAHWNTSIARYIAANLAQVQQPPPGNGTLQHLADAAVGKAETMSGETEEVAKGSEGETLKFPASMTRGYLSLMR
ncbi:Glucose-responsive transcription factor [Pseudocyphellaria aurata]|nr:Glucose-responsive transcription factor [Pseudocyphellaria aurata]